MFGKIELVEVIVKHLQIKILSVHAEFNKHPAYVIILELDMDI